MSPKLVLCDCGATQSFDRDALEAASGLACSKVHRSLCTGQIDKAGAAIAGGDVIIACQQERARFEDLAAELGVHAPGFVDLRDRAGWTAAGENPAPKMAALAAEAAMPAAAPGAIDVLSAGTCLVLGPGDVALRAATELADALAVTALMTDAGEPPVDRRFDVIRGRVRTLSGALGGFELTIDALQLVNPAGRGDFTLTEPRDGGQSQCDIVLDLTGDTPLVPAPQKREGYLRADPGDRNAVNAAMMQAVQLVGTFEKPLYVRLEESLCAHSRAGQVGCSNCLDNCPTGAISPDGEHVAIDPMICAGCGACSALCPSGAISYDAPPVDHLFRRMDVMARAYRKAGGAAPRLLVCDTGHGREMIALAARYGRGLPGDVIPLELDVISGFGHAEMLAALACGFARVDILLSPTTERAAPIREQALAEAIAGAGRIDFLDPADPDVLSDRLYSGAAPTPLADPVLPLGTRRQVTRLAAKALNPGAEAPLPLPESAPYGAVLVDTDACTLCLSCVSLCPSGALLDNPDMPQLRFQEDACLQCGLCANICPEDAITLQPQLDLSDAALSQRVLNEEEPFACVECGALFGVRSTVEKITEKLAGSHAMFANPEAARMIQMCDDCRVKAQFHSRNNPFDTGKTRQPRTTDDYFSDRKDH